MYDKERKTLLDRREMLKIKLKSLAEESRIIRREERKTHGQLRNELREHRVGVVRSEARHTHIAYGLIRGLSLEQIEKEGSAAFNADKVNTMIRKYGATKAPPLAKAA